MTHRRPTLALALCAALGGCVATPGEFCHRDEDCVAPLRCTGTAEVRGVCVYPQAIPDAPLLRDGFVIPPRPPDGGADGDAAPDATPDGMDAAADAADAAAPPAELGVADAAPDLPGPGPEPDLDLADASAADG